MARRIEPVLLGNAIRAAAAPLARSSMRSGRDPALPELEGAVTRAVETRGKHLLIRFEDDRVIHSHMGMNGSWDVAAPGRRFRRPDRSAWLLLELDRERVAQFGGPTLRLVSAAALAHDQRLATLGPDILDPGFDPERAAGRLRASPDPVGVALLDQRVIAGIGNIFKSEACFEAAISPLRPAVSLTAEEALALIETARDQMVAAVATGRRPGRIYRRTGRACPRCGAGRIVTAGQGDDARTTWLCPICQA